MAIRVNDPDLRSTLKCGDIPDLLIFMQSANVIVDALLGTSSLSSPVLTLIEMYVAAHLYTVSEERGSLAAETIGDVTERYHNTYKAGFGSTRFGQQAIVLDSTGVLARESAKAEKAAIKSAEFRIL